MSGEQNNAMFNMLRDIHEGQIEQARTLGRIEGNYTSTCDRLDKLEASATRNWWMTYVVTPALVIGHGILKYLRVVNI